MRSVSARLFLLTTLLTPVTPAIAQQFTAGPAAGTVIPLPDGRLLILNSDPAGVVIGGLVDQASPAATRLDFAAGDRVTRFQGTGSPRLAGVDSLYRATVAGSEVTIELRRGTLSHTVRFLRSPASAERTMVISSPGKKDAGAWVTGGGSDDSEDLEIAGAHIRDNGEGLPEVTHRSSHPAMAAVPLRPGDVITTINGQSIAALAGLRLGYDRLVAGDSVQLTVTRSGRPVTVVFTKPDP